jgi:hypothetical protein
MKTLIYYDGIVPFMKGVLVCFIMFASIGLITAAACSSGSPTISALDGVISDTENNILVGAQVVAESSCSQTETSLTDGYYEIYNLPFGSGTSVQVSASYTHPQYGVGTGESVVTTSSSIETINVVICYPPSQPVLTHIPSGHETSVTFTWTSGSDPVGGLTHDDFILNGDIENNIKSGSGSFSKTGTLGLGSVSWGARTCNDVCCSDWVEQNLNVGNSPPSVPTDLTYPETSAILTLGWSSGVDPDGDATYDPFHLGNENSIGSALESALPPMIAVAELLVSWKVRTCDIPYNACSDWIEIDAVTCNEISNDCPEGGSVEDLISNYRKDSTRRGASISCNGIPLSDDLVQNIDFKPREKVVSVSGKNLSLYNVEYCLWCYDGIQNGDEKGVDCGGSCPDCGVPRVFAGINTFPWWCFALLALLVLVILVVLYYIEKKLGVRGWKFEKKR